MIKVAVAALLLTGCTTKVVYPEYDESLLRKCEEIPELEGKDGKSVIEWSEKAGPKITACIRDHNALVTIIKDSK